MPNALTREEQWERLKTWLHENIEAIERGDLERLPASFTGEARRGGSGSVPDLSAGHAFSGKLGAVRLASLKKCGVDFFSAVYVVFSPVPLPHRDRRAGWKQSVQFFVLRAIGVFGFLRVEDTAVLLVKSSSSPTSRRTADGKREWWQGACWDCRKFPAYACHWLNLAQL